jgi:molybdate transport system substrate-binding protein
MPETSNEFRVMTSGAFTAAHLALIPRIEALTKKKVITVTTSMGTGDASIANRLKRGEAVDIIIVAESAMRQFIGDGYVIGDSIVPLAQSSIGLAVRAGAPKPDLSTADGLRKTLLEAKTIAYSASVSGQHLTKEVFQRLGIADECLPKSRFVGGGERTGAVVARGEADVAVQQMSELLPVPGIAHITPFPPELQKVSTFCGGVAVNATDVELARSVLQFLGSGEAAAAIEATGLEALT